MRVRPVMAWSGAVLATLLVVGPVAAQGFSSDWQSLAGISRVGVLITVDEELLGHVTEARLEEIVVDQLTRAGVVVVAADELRDGNLSLALVAMPDVQQRSIVGLFVAKYADFRQGADLRKGGQYAVVTTWADHGVAYWGVAVAREAAEAVALETARKFVSDWVIARAQQ
jgi:hypothetical protein